MKAIQLKLNRKFRGAFVIQEGLNRVAEMVFAISEGRLIVYYTYVSLERRGQGLGGKLLENMVGYARSNQLKVVAACLYVMSQFEKHPEKYNDLWN